MWLYCTGSCKNILKIVSCEGFARKDIVPKCLDRFFHIFRTWQINIIQLLFDIYLLHQFIFQRKHTDIGVLKIIGYCRARVYSFIELKIKRDREHLV